MASHHFIGNGIASAALGRAASSPNELLKRIAEEVRATGLEVVDHRAVGFENGGLTLVWVLAESHLVLHHWVEEGFATLDLHICDYRGSNAAKAAALVEALTAYCFVAGTANWSELHLEDPAPVLSR